MLLTGVAPGHALLFYLAGGDRFNVIHLRRRYRQRTACDNLTFIVKQPVSPDGHTATGNNFPRIALRDAVFGDGARVVVVGELIAIGVMANHAHDADDPRLVLIHTDIVVIDVIAHAIIQAVHLVFRNLLLRDQHVFSTKMVIVVIDAGDIQRHIPRRLKGGAVIIECTALSDSPVIVAERSAQGQAAAAVDQRVLAVI